MSRVIINITISADCLTVSYDQSHNLRRLQSGDHLCIAVQWTVFTKVCRIIPGALNRELLSPVTSQETAARNKLKYIVGFGDAN